MKKRILPQVGARLVPKTKGRESYWLESNKSILPSTGCYPTGRAIMRNQEPVFEWSCPNENPGVPHHPVFGFHEWWKRPLSSQSSMGRCCGLGLTPTEELAQRQATAPGWGLVEYGGIGLAAVGGLLGLTGLYFLLRKKKGGRK